MAGSKKASKKMTATEITTENTSSPRGRRGKTSATKSKSKTKAKKPISRKKATTKPTKNTTPAIKTKARHKKYLHTQLILKLVDKRNQSPLSNYTVLVTVGKNKKKAGTITCVSDHQGRVGVQIDTEKHKTETGHVSLNITVLDTRQNEIHHQIIAINERERTVPTVEVENIETANSHRIATLSDSLNLKVSSALSKALVTNKIDTLAAMRINGTNNVYGSLTSSTDRDQLSELEAHARLEAISENIEDNAVLINAGFGSTNNITTLSRTAFVRMLHNKISNERASTIYKNAVENQAIVNNYIAGTRVTEANAELKGKSLLDKKPECRDCETILSPSAYYKALLDYCVKHIEIDVEDPDKRAISAQTLRSVLHQPFDELPLECNWVSREVNQLRIVTEVLRSYATSTEPFQPPFKQGLFKQQEQMYRREVYSTLLENLGTSFEEMQLLATRNDKEKHMVADTIGIDITHLNDIKYNPATQPESLLERVFGYQDSTRDPLVTGVKTVDEDLEIAKWQFDGVRWRHNTDANGKLYLSMGSDTGPHIDINVYRDAAHQELVAKGKSREIGDWIELRENNYSGLSGRVIVDKYQGGDDIQFKMVPDILIWKYTKQEQAWQLLDWPDQSEGPILTIDPDIITDDDFRTGGDESHPALDIYRTRKTLIHEYREALVEHYRESSDTYDSKQCFEYMVGVGIKNSSITELLAKRQELRSDNESLHNSANNYLNERGLTEQHLMRLLEIWDKLASTPEEETLSEIEQDDTINIYVQCFKLRRVEDWRTEERHNLISINPLVFCLSGGNDELPRWRSSVEERTRWESALKQSLKPPIIDSDRIFDNEIVRDPLKIDGGLSERIYLWVQSDIRIMRKEVVSKAGEKLEYLNSAIREYIGDTNLLELSERAEKGESIEQELRKHTLNYAAFKFLVRALKLLKTEEDNPGISEYLFEDSEWDNVYDILLQVRKIRNYHVWRQREKANGLVLAPQYFQIQDNDESDLNSWRVSHQERRDWLDKLETRISLQQGMIDGLQTGIESAEEAALPILRNAFVNALDAEWGAEHVIQFPWGLVTDKNNYLYVTDLKEPGEIVKYDLEGNVLKVIAANAPFGITIFRGSAEQYIYYTEFAEGNVYKIDLDGNEILHWETGHGGDWGFAYDITSDSSGNIYIVDIANHRVEKYNKNGVFKTEWGEWGDQNGNFRFPKSIAVSDAGEVFVADSNRIQVFSTEGVFINSIKCNGIEKVCLDRDNNIYVTEPGKRRILKLDVKGMYINHWDLDDAPISITVGSLGDLFVGVTKYFVGIDNYGRVFRLINYEGIITYNYDFNWLTKLLLLDIGNTSCKKTTRLSVLINTLQACIRTIRQDNGILGDFTFVDDESYEDEWKWIGSYGNWRAAMYVFHYPDTILFPAFQRKKTPIIEEILGQLSSSTQLTNKQAQLYANQYSLYLQDVSEIRIEATCDITDRRSDKEPSICYIFGVSPKSGYAYYKVYIDNIKYENHDKYWKRIDSAHNIKKCTGAALVNTRLYKNTILVIFMVEDTERYNNYKILIKKYYVDTEIWETEVVLEAPSADFHDNLYDVKFAKTTATLDDRSELSQFLILCTSRATYIAMLNKELNEWGSLKIDYGGDETATDHTYPIAIRDYLRGIKYCQVIYDINPSGHAVVMVAASNNVYSIYLLRLQNTSEIPAYIIVEEKILVHTQQYIGALPFYRGNSAVVIAVLYTQENIVRAIIIEQLRDLAWETYPVSGSLELYSIAEYFGNLNSSRTLVTVSSRLNFDSNASDAIPGESKYVYTKLMLKESSLVIEYKGRATLPLEIQGTSPIIYQISDTLSGDAIEIQKEIYSSMYKYIKNDDCLKYLDEAYYELRVGIASALQRSKRYQSALRWLRTIYDYHMPIEERKKYPYLDYEYKRVVDDPCNPSDDWLLNPLDPHAIAKEYRPGAYSRFTIFTIIQILLDYADAEYTRDNAESIPRARETYEKVLELLDAPEFQAQLATCSSVHTGRVGYSISLPTIGLFNLKSQGETSFCIPPNPFLYAYRLKAEINLYKIKNCQNIAGMTREVEPYSTEIDMDGMSPVLAAAFRTAGDLLAGGTPVRPTQYKYITLIQRAKELIQIAQQMENSMVSAKEKREQNAYEELKARQDVQLTKSQVKLQDIKITHSENSVRLAELQTERSHLQATRYQEMIDDGLNAYESTMIGAYIFGGIAKTLVASLDAPLRVSGAVNTAAGAGYGAAVATTAVATTSVLSTLKAVAETQVILADTSAQVASVYASHERREQEWNTGKALAQHDVKIGHQQTKIAKDGVRISKQEKNIAIIQAQNAETISDYLQNEEFNADLYDWMAGILQSIYSYFLQTATATAKMAEAQLAFERQEIPTGLIQADYWDTPVESGAPADEEQKEKNGVTGSARLLADIYRLDQNRFENDKRKLNLTKNISLSQYYPLELYQFRSTGELYFSLPMDLFDRDYPGHYLRLIKKVRLSIIALIPPMAGVRATLYNSGKSKAIGSGPLYQPMEVNRESESVALSSPEDATGVFELDQQADMLLPFEGSGVESTWRLSMPMAANPFDYNTIADVILSIDYTALSSEDYRRQVIDTLDRDVTQSHIFSLKEQYPDQWYLMNNPPDQDKPVSITFDLTSSLLPPNVENLRLKHLLLYFSTTEGNETPVENIELYYRIDDSFPKIGGKANTINGMVNTELGQGIGWMGIVDQGELIGKWELIVNQNTIERIKNENIENILFIVKYNGELPQWN